MKILTLLSLIVLLSFTARGQNTTNAAPAPSGKGHIVAGCLIDGLGIFLISQAVRVSKDPMYNNIQGGKNAQQSKSLGIAALGGVCLIVGTLNIAKGVRMNQKRKWALNLNPTGISFTCRL